MGLLAAGTKEFKRPPETSAGTARDYSTTFGAVCKDCGQQGSSELESENHQPRRARRITKDFALDGFPSCNFVSFVVRDPPNAPLTDTDSSLSCYHSGPGKGKR